MGERFDSLPASQQRLIARSVLKSVSVPKGASGGAHKHRTARSLGRVVIEGPEEFSEEFSD